MVDVVQSGLLVDAVQSGVLVELAWSVAFEIGPRSGCFEHWKILISSLLEPGHLTAVVGESNNQPFYRSPPSQTSASDQLFSRFDLSEVLSTSVLEAVGATPSTVSDLKHSV